VLDNIFVSNYNCCPKFKRGGSGVID